LRAIDERKKTGSSENSFREQFASQSSKRDTKFSSTVGNAGVGVTSPSKQTEGNKGKGGGFRQVYMPVGTIQPVNPTCADPNANKQVVPYSAKPAVREDADQLMSLSENDKKRKTPSNSENSADAALQSCQSQ
jgi:hypothetical protein